MPELPEVETVVRQLNPYVEGKTVKRFDVLDKARLGKLSTRPFVQRPIARVFRHGKHALFEFGPRIGATPQGAAARPLWLAVHLRMTGRLLWSPTKQGNTPHLRARLQLDEGAVDFVDVRRFGTLEMHRSADEFAAQGLDPTTPAFTVQALTKLLKGKQPLKTWLLRQDRLVGLGNIYASEILFEAGLHPERAPGGLSPDEIKRLHRATRAVLQRAIKHCGTTFSDFQDAHGVTGSYQRYLKVYSRDGEPCRKCDDQIVRVTQQQRSTFFCLRCQPLP